MIKLSPQQLAEIRVRIDEYRTHLCVASDDRENLSDHITAMEDERAELRECLRIAVSWAENWDAPYLDDQEWVEDDYPRFRVLLKQEQEP